MMKKLTLLLLTVLLSGCAHFSAQKTDTLTVSKPYPRVVALLNHQLAHCIARNSTFFRMGVLVKSHTYGNDTLIRVLRSDSSVVETDLPMIALLNVSKQGNQTVVNVYEKRFILSSDFHLTASVGRWLKGDLRCKVDGQ